MVVDSLPNGPAAEQSVRGGASSARQRFLQTHCGQSERDPYHISPWLEGSSCWWWLVMLCSALCCVRQAPRAQPSHSTVGRQSGVAFFATEGGAVHWRKCNIVLCAKTEKSEVNRRSFDVDLCKSDQPNLCMSKIFPRQDNLNILSKALRTCTKRTSRAGHHPPSRNAVDLLLFLQLYAKKCWEMVPHHSQQAVREKKKTTDKKTGVKFNSTSKCYSVLLNKHSLTLWIPTLAPTVVFVPSLNTGNTFFTRDYQLI